jgi:hypothetical protein
MHESQDGEHGGFAESKNFSSGLEVEQIPVCVVHSGNGTWEQNRDLGAMALLCPAAALLVRGVLCQAVRAADRVGECTGSHDITCWGLSMEGGRRESQRFAITLWLCLPSVL